MIHSFTHSLAAAAALFAAYPLSAAATLPGTNASPGIYIVFLHRRETNVDAVVKELGFDPIVTFHRALKGFTVELDSDMATTLRRDNRVAFVGESPVKSIVMLRPDADPAAFVEELGLHPRFVYGAWRRPAWFKGDRFKGFAYALDVPTLMTLDQDDRVRTVEPDSGKVRVTDQYPAGIMRMGLPSFPVHQVTNTWADIINVDVAVLDTGIQIDTTALTNKVPFNTTVHEAHPALNVFKAVGLADPGYYGDDWDGHGTAMAGVIGGANDGPDYGSFNIVGVAPGVRLWSVQVLGPTQKAWANVLAGLDYIAQHADQIEVVNASLEDSTGSTPYAAGEQAVLSIVNQGTVFVAGAGNDAGGICGADQVCGDEDDALPAALPEVMTVSAMDPTTDKMWDQSNFSVVSKDPSYVTSPGLGVDVAAPGVNILSTYKDSSTGFGTGTSDATAYVTGLVALYIAANGRATNAAGVYHIRQEIVDHSLPQTQWASYPNTGNYGGPAPLAMPSEAWVPQPRFYSESRTPQGVALSFAAVPGYQYRVQYTDSLSGSNHWADLAVTNGVGRLMTVIVKDPAPGEKRFYRLQRPPSQPVPALPTMTLPLSLRTAVGSGVASQPGFRFRVVQLPRDPLDVSSEIALYVENAEQMLAGLWAANVSLIPGTNTADLSSFTDGGYSDIPGQINMGDTFGGADFTPANGHPMDPVPGIPGSFAQHTTPEYEASDFAAEILTYVEFPKAGLYTMGVNTGDPFRVMPAETAPGFLGDTIYVTQPAAAAGIRIPGMPTLGPAPTFEGFGPPFPKEALTAQLVYVNPSDACSGVANCAELAGKIALIDRGACDFDSQVLNVQNCGAIAAVVVDNVAETPWVMGMGDLSVGSQIAIPSLMISQADGELLKSHLADPGGLWVSIGQDPEEILGEFDGITGPGRVDTTFSFEVPEAGVYPFRLVWDHGDGGYDLEWFSVDAAGNRILINDSVPGALKAYRERTSSP